MISIYFAIKIRGFIYDAYQKVNSSQWKIDKRPVFNPITLNIYTGKEANQQINKLKLLLSFSLLRCTHK